MSADGEAVAFGSAGSLTGYDNRDAESGEPDEEVYHFSAASGKLSCVSCSPSGARPSGRLVEELKTRFAAYWAAAQIPPAEHSLYYSRALSESGRQLFFESFVPLLPGDTNGKRDVYEWEEAGAGSCSAESPSYSPFAGGCVSPISSGESVEDSYFLDASPSGSDVFFATGQSLVGRDPGLIDIYDARAAGGFADASPPTPPCEGETCQSRRRRPRISTRRASASGAPATWRTSASATAARRAAARCAAMAGRAA